MKICIIGCGAIGSIYGAHLAAHDEVEVWAYDKNRKHVDAINRYGLRIFGVAEHISKVRATVNPDELPDCDLGIIATKVYHTRDAMEATAHAFSHGSICSLQNGIGNEEIIAEYVPDVMSGTTYVGGHISGPGTVDFDTNEKTWLAPSKGNVPFESVQKLADLLSAKGLETLPVPDLRGAKWAKLIFNAAANPVCALTRLPFGEVYRQPALRNLVIGLAQEGIAVAKAQGIELDSDPIKTLDKASETAATHIPSMSSDLQNKRKTEIEALNNGIVKYGRQVGVPCPLNEAIVGLICGFESSW